MAFQSIDYTDEQRLVIAVIVSVIVGMAWATSDFTGIQRITSVTLTALATLGGAMVGVRLFEWDD